MKNKLLLALIVVPSVYLSAQTIDRQVVASAGGYASSGSLQVSYTVGEAVITTGTSASLVLTQGFQQPDDLTVGVVSTEASTLGIRVYPVPTKLELNIEMSPEKPLDVDITVVDMLGQSMSTLRCRAELGARQTIDFSNFAAGNYIVRFTDKDGHLLGTAKAQKVQ